MRNIVPSDCNTLARTRRSAWLPLCGRRTHGIDFRCVDETTLRCTARASRGGRLPVPRTRRQSGRGSQEARANPSAGLDVLKARLEPFDGPTIAALRVALLDGDPFVRQTSVAILGRLGDPCAKLMSRLLKDDEEAVRAAAEEALVRVGKPAVPFLGELLLAEPPSSDAKVRAARALGRIGDPEGLPFLVETLKRFRGGGFRTALVCEALAGSSDFALRREPPRGSPDAR